MESWRFGRIVSDGDNGSKKNQGRGKELDGVMIKKRVGSRNAVVLTRGRLNDKKFFFKLIKTLMYVTQRHSVIEINKLENYSSL